MRRDSLAFRLIAGAALWSVIALVAGGLVLSAIFRNSVENSFDSRLNVLLHSLIATTEVNAEGKIARQRGLSETRFDLAYSGWYWQIWPVAPRPAVRSRSLFDQSLDLSAAETVERNAVGLKVFDTVGPENQPLRVVERRVMLPGYDVPVSFAVAGERSEMNTEIQSFNTWLIVSMAALGAGLLVALLIQVRYGLRPLENVRASLAQIRSGRATRLEGDFPSEIEPLAEELNGLLESNREVLERARTHVGNLAHALKTPLSVLTNEARTHDDAFGETVRRMVTQMREQIDRHLTRARMAASANVLGANTPVKPVLMGLANALERIHAERGISIEVVCDDETGFRGEAQDLEEVVGNLLDNACKWSGGRVEVRLAGERGPGGRQLLIRIEDDGPGLSEQAMDKVLRRGVRLDEKTPGSGLGLDIVKELVDVYGGSLELKRSGLGGLLAELRLPAARQGRPGAAPRG